MSELADQFMSNFPLPSFRDGQKEALTKIADAIESDYKFIFIEAPTGWGKSPMGIAIARSYDSSYYLTIQKFLQDQIMKDFSDHVVDLKGRNAYPCTLYEKEGITGMNCDLSKCKVEDKRAFSFKCLPDGTKNLSISKCPYFTRVYEALCAQTCLMNFKSFLFQSAVIKRFGPRDLLVIDECHQIEPELMGFVSLEMSDRQFRTHGIVFSKLETAEEYAIFFIENDIKTRIADQIRLAQMADDLKAENKLSRLLIRLLIFLKSVNSGEWVPKFESKNKYNNIELKPIYVNTFAHNYLFSMADTVVMMSATILSADVMRNSLGINKADSYAIRLPNKFKVEHRPIIRNYAGSMRYRNKKKTMPKLVEKTNDICEEHREQRGIIHTHNFEIAELLMDRCDKDAADRFLFQKNFIDKTIMIDKHKRTNDSIIVAPAMHEGLDLPDDLCRFQIICKVPYPSFVDNPQMQMRMELSPEWYEWLTALKICQSVGRGVRSETDFASTYVIDSDFGWFVKKNKDILPKWILEAIT